MRRLARAWHEVEAIEPVRERAERALALHVLAAADALQLGAALLAVGDRPKNRVFITADDRLGEARPSAALPREPGETANQVGSGALGAVGPAEVGGMERSDVPEEYREQVGRYFSP